MLPGLFIVNLSKFLTSNREECCFTAIVFSRLCCLCSKDFPLPLDAWERMHNHMVELPWPSIRLLDVSCCDCHIYCFCCQRISKMKVFVPESI